jgi:hypothetical protein
MPMRIQPGAASPHNSTGFKGVFKAWWPGDAKKPKNADVHGFKVILHHPRVVRGVHVRTFNKAQDAAKVLKAWERMTRTGVKDMQKKHTQKDLFIDVFVTCMQKAIHDEEQKNVVDIVKIEKLQDKKARITAAQDLTASLVLQIVDELYD